MAKRGDVYIDMTKKLTVIDSTTPRGISKLIAKRKYTRSIAYKKQGGRPGNTTLRGNSILVVDFVSVTIKLFTWTIISSWIKGLFNRY